MTKKFINQRKKTISENFGSSEIQIIAKTLTDLGFSCVFEPKIYSDKFSTANKIRNPDLKISFGKMITYLESDGKVHQTLEMPNDRTQKRNEDFERAEIPYILINHETLHELKKILKIAIPKDDLIKIISVYCVLEQYAKFLAREK